MFPVDPAQNKYDQYKKPVSESNIQDTSNVEDVPSQIIKNMNDKVRWTPFQTRARGKMVGQQNSSQTLNTKSEAVNITQISTSKNHQLNNTVGGNNSCPHINSPRIYVTKAENNNPADIHRYENESVTSSTSTVDTIADYIPIPKYTSKTIGGSIIIDIAKNIATGQSTARTRAKTLGQVNNKPRIQDSYPGGGDTIDRTTDTLILRAGISLLGLKSLNDKSVGENLISNPVSDQSNNGQIDISKSKMLLQNNLEMNRLHERPISPWKVAPIEKKGSPLFWIRTRSKTSMNAAQIDAVLPPNVEPSEKKGSPTLWIRTRSKTGMSNPSMLNITTSLYEDQSDSITTPADINSPGLDIIRTPIVVDQIRRLKTNQPKTSHLWDMSHIHNANSLPLLVDQAQSNSLADDISGSKVSLNTSNFQNKRSKSSMNYEMEETNEQSASKSKSAPLLSLIPSMDKLSAKAQSSSFLHRIIGSSATNNISPTVPMTGKSNRLNGIFKGSPLIIQRQNIDSTRSPCSSLADHSDSNNLPSTPSLKIKAGVLSSFRRRYNWDKNSAGPLSAPVDPPQKIYDQYKEPVIESNIPKIMGKPLIIQRPNIDSSCSPCSALADHSAGNTLLLIPKLQIKPGGLSSFRRHNNSAGPLSAPVDPPQKIYDQYKEPVTESNIPKIMGKPLIIQRPNIDSNSSLCSALDESSARDTLLLTMGLKINIDSTGSPCSAFTGHSDSNNLPSTTSLKIEPSGLSAFERRYNWDKNISLSTGALLDPVDPAQKSYDPYNKHVTESNIPETSNVEDVPSRLIKNMNHEVRWNEFETRARGKTIGQQNSSPKLNTFYHVKSEAVNITQISTSKNQTQLNNTIVVNNSCPRLNAPGLNVSMAENRIPRDIFLYQSESVASSVSTVDNVAQYIPNPKTGATIIIDIAKTIANGQTSSRTRAKTLGQVNNKPRVPDSYPGGGDAIDRAADNLVLRSLLGLKSLNDKSVGENSICNPISDQFNDGQIAISKSKMLLHNNLEINRIHGKAIDNATGLNTKVELPSTNDMAEDRTIKIKYDPYIEPVGQKLSSQGHRSRSKTFIAAGMSNPSMLNFTTSLYEDQIDIIKTPVDISNSTGLDILSINDSRTPIAVDQIRRARTNEPKTALCYKSLIQNANSLPLLVDQPQSNSLADDISGSKVSLNTSNFQNKRSKSSMNYEMEETNEQSASKSKSAPLLSLIPSMDKLSAKAQSSSFLHRIIGSSATNDISPTVPTIGKSNRLNGIFKGNPLIIQRQNIDSIRSPCSALVDHSDTNNLPSTPTLKIKAGALSSFRRRYNWDNNISLSAVTLPAAISNERLNIDSIMSPIENNETNITQAGIKKKTPSNYSLKNIHLSADTEPPKSSVPKLKKNIVDISVNSPRPVSNILNKPVQLTANIFAAARKMSAKVSRNKSSIVVKPVDLDCKVITKFDVLSTEACKNATDEMMMVSENTMVSCPDLSNKRHDSLWGNLVGMVYSKLDEASLINTEGVTNTNTKHSTIYPEAASIIRTLPIGLSQVCIEQPQQGSEQQAAAGSPKALTDPKRKQASEINIKQHIDYPALSRYQTIIHPKRNESKALPIVVVSSPIEQPANGPYEQAEASLSPHIDRYLNTADYLTKLKAESLLKLNIGLALIKTCESSEMNLKSSVNNPTSQRMVAAPCIETLPIMLSSYPDCSIKSPDRVWGDMIAIFDSKLAEASFANIEGFINTNTKQSVPYGHRQQAEASGGLNKDVHSNKTKIIKKKSLLKINTVGYSEMNLKSPVDNKGQTMKMPDKKSCQVM
jgi:hypothetical protein